MRYIALSKRRALGSQFSCSVTGVALLFGANKAAELWPQYFHKAPFGAAVVAFLGFAWNCYRDSYDWRLLSLLENRSEKEVDKLDIG
jgi:hypothetical protein